MSNPYESPKSNSNAVAQRTGCQPRVWRTLLFGFGGAFVGYIALTIVANLEAWEFYTLRSTLTGERAMARIVAHPADRWIVLGLFTLFVVGGAFAGFWVARRNARLRTGERW